MEAVQTAQGVNKLSEVIKALNKAGVINRESFGIWANKNTDFLNKQFDYNPARGMPPIRSLVRPFFHPTMPLIGLNYTQSAHNTLYEFADGWTVPLRLCRGIVFDRQGNLVALPFPKFFNYGEHSETTNMPDEPWTATMKYDGHLGIIFKFDGKIRITTRGDFMSRTAQIGRYQLARQVRLNNWKKLFPENLTLLVEIVHPETSVYVDYSGRKDFVIIGAYDRETFYDPGPHWLDVIARKLGLTNAETWQGNDIKTLIEHMKDPLVQNKEGWVIRFENGLRVKVKYRTYIGKMVADKLSYTYLMNRAQKGNLQKMLETLPEEIYGAALRMLGEIMLGLAAPGTLEDKWRQLYSLESGERQTPYFQKVCRDLVRAMTATTAKS